MQDVHLCMYIRAGKRENLVPIKPANFGMPYNENVSSYITSIAR